MATISEALAIALEHQKAGRLQAAEQIYRQILAVEPYEPDALNLMGAVASQTGRQRLAVEYIERAIALKRTEAVYHNNLGIARRLQGELEQAAACCRRALKYKPNYPEACVNLGNVLKDQGKLEEAAACYRRALNLRPDYVEARSNVGTLLKEQGKPVEAAACYRRALELEPKNPGLYGNLGAALIDAGRLDEAAMACRRALELNPDLVEAHTNLGNVFKNRGKMDDAVVCFRRALAIKPQFAAASYGLGVALEAIGDLSAAESCFRAALRENPRLAFVHHKLAGLLGRKLPDEDLAEQRRLLEHGNLPDEQRLFLHFSLAHVLDARGEYAEAAEHLDRANSLQFVYWQRRGQAHDPNMYKTLVDAVIATFTPDFFERARGFGLETKLPVFVVGLPRSGTTLVEQILAAHSQVFGAGEIKLVGDIMAAFGEQPASAVVGMRRLDRETTQRLAAQHLQRLQVLQPAALRIVDKTLDNCFALGLLATLYPQAQFVNCRRDLRDVAVSCWTTRFEEVRWANDQRHIASWFHDYRRLMEHWRKVLPVPLLDVDYEETVADLEGVARRLVAWCGLDWEPRCIEFYRARRTVTTASSVQVRQPLYTTSVARWKHYEKPLADLFEALSAGC